MAESADEHLDRTTPPAGRSGDPRILEVAVAMMAAIPGEKPWAEARPHERAGYIVAARLHVAAHDALKKLEG